jgi:molecular chaperone GrpE (heat shock protein)
MQYGEFNSNTKRIQELEQRVYYVENKLDDTRTVLLRLQSDFDYYKHRKERNRLG